ncbi:major facilitator superfamily MFS_1 [Parvibaculum lavamentivorans DS-1]|uniref:Major facilitator superfamily MFS_1 n=1 Tax=Parvibaculum lavamentivorans (strain DS-1 / DSM 13023 / NCIMB 13966) TaxID=402881 RepID=A7HXS5_PARL1|nr:MFS transporter [Parvibaculum lavamentivorans]ABS64708.1 major facilitator superfamily MFS_1 [Parvibaculum lavamentivorans DS-1]
MSAESATRSDQEEPAPRFFYGWYVVGAVLVIMTVTAGLGFYNLSVYLKAFVVQGGFSVAATSGATACFFIASGISGLGVAALIERYDPRWVITAGAFFSAFATLGAGYVTELWQLYLFYILFGVGYAGAALIPGTTLVARWFARRRSVALSYASTGLSLGGILLTPLSAWAIEHLGLGGAAPWLALVLIVGIVPVAWVLIRPSPQSMGLGPDGDPIARDESGVPLPADGIDFERAIRSRFFIFTTAAYIFAMMAQVGTIAHQYSLIFARSGDSGTARLAVASMAAASIIGRLVGGQALAYMPSRGFVLGLTVVQGAALACYAFAESTPMLIATTIIFGLTVGNLLMMQPLMVAEAFGLKAYGRVYSLTQLFMTAGVATGPAAIGFLYTWLGGYEVAFLIMAISSLVAFGLIVAAGPVRALIESKQNA